MKVYTNESDHIGEDHLRDPSRLESREASEHSASDPGGGSLSGSQVAAGRQVEDVGLGENGSGPQDRTRSSLMEDLVVNERSRVASEILGGSQPGIDVGSASELFERNNFDLTGAVRKSRAKAQVKKPPKDAFIRTEPDENLWKQVRLIFPSDSRDFYVVSRRVQEEAVVARFSRPYLLVPYITRQGVLGLCPCCIDLSRGSLNPWHQSLLQAMNIARTKWISISSSTISQNYDILEPEAALPEPDWGDARDDKYLGLMLEAFSGLVIQDKSHPLLLALRGVA